MKLKREIPRIQILFASWVGGSVMSVMDHPTPLAILGLILGFAGFVTVIFMTEKE